MQRNKRELFIQNCMSRNTGEHVSICTSMNVQVAAQFLIGSSKEQIKDTVKDKLGKVDCQIMSGSASAGACLCQALYWEIRCEVEKDTA